jgi:hypothetical protein
MLEELKNAIVAMKWRDKLTALKLRRDARTEAPGHQKNAASLKSKTPLQEELHCQTVRRTYVRRVEKCHSNEMA